MCFPEALGQRATRFAARLFASWGFAGLDGRERAFVIGRVGVRKCPERVLRAAFQRNVGATRTRAAIVKEVVAYFDVDRRFWCKVVVAAAWHSAKGCRAESGCWPDATQRQ